MLKTGILTIILLLTVMIFGGCKTSQSLRGKRTPTIQKVGEDYFVKPGGWDLLPLGELKKGESSISHQPGADGKLIAINLTKLYPLSEIITDEPLVSVGYNLGDLKTLSVIKCEMKGRVFEYSVQAVKVMTEEKTLKIVENGSPLFYRYYDMDGDGLFETLVTDSSDVLVPDWAQSAE